MAENKSFTKAFVQFTKLLRLEKRDVAAIYWLAALSGLFYLALPLGIQSIVGFVSAATLSTSLIVLIVFVMMALLINGAMDIKQLEIIEKVEQKIFVRFAYEYAAKLPNLDLQKNQDKYLPELVNRFFDVTGLQKSIYKLLLDIPASALQIIIGTVLLAFYHPIFIAFGLTLLILVFTVIRMTSPMGYLAALRTSDYKYLVGDWLEQIARNIRFFKFNNIHEYHITKTDRLLEGYVENKTKLFKILKVQYWSLVTFKLLIFSTMLILGVSLLVDQQINIGQFVAADIVIIGMISSIEKLIYNIDKLYEGLAALEKLNKISDAPAEYSGSLLLSEASEGVEVAFENVSFEYNDQSPVFNNLSFKVAKGQWAEIKGGVSSGKSTVFNLLSGAFPEYSGNILINGIPIHNFDVNRLRHHMGVMLQHSALMEGTVLENICLGHPLKNMDYIVELSKYTGLDKHIYQTKEGFDYQIEPYKKNISFEFSKALLLTRALYNHPRLLLLEDPFTGMGSDNIQALVHYIKENGNPTVLIINNTSDEMPFCQVNIEVK